MLKSPRKVIQKQLLFSKNDRLLVGVSGGLDSMVLCDILHKEGYELFIAHCNYQLRGKDSDLDEKLITDWANERSIPCFVKKCPIKNGTQIQELARKLRYSYFEEIKNQEQIKFLLTAHHADDQIETFLLNLSRGAGLKGLKGIAFKENNLIRPLLEVRKSELYDYAIQNEVPYREDFTNHESSYLRNFFRNDILTLLNKRIPTFDELVLRSIHHLSELDKIVSILSMEWQSENIFYKEDLIEILKPDKNKFYFLSLFLVELGFHPETIENIQIHYEDIGKRFTDRNQHELLIDREMLFIRKLKQEEHIDSEYEINKLEGSFSTGNGNLKWQVEEPTALSTSKNHCYLDFDQIALPIVIRKWQSGDQIMPLGMEGKHKKLQDVFSDEKLNLFEKEQIYLLCWENEILWVPSIIRSDLAKINTSTKKVLHFTFTITNIKLCKNKVF